MPRVFFASPHSVVGEETERAAVITVEKEEKTDEDEEEDGEGSGWITQLKVEGSEGGATAPVHSTATTGGSLPNNKKQQLEGTWDTWEGKEERG